MDKLSPYYAYYIRGVIESQGNSIAKIRIAAESLEEALQFKLTQEAYNALLVCYIKLDDEEQYESTLLDAAENFPYFYASCGIFYANSSKKFNKEKSLSWFEKGLETKEPKAFSDLANEYFKGCKAFSRDLTKAEEILNKGLELNDPKWNGYFNYALGLIMNEKKEYASAADFFRKAQELGYEQSSYNLALLYRDGLGVKKNYEEYILNLLRNLNANSALEIGRLYLDGKYAVTDKGISLIYFDFAAKSGNAEGALMSAALLIDKGKPDENLLYKYLNIALNNKAIKQNINEHYEKIERALGCEVARELKERIAKTGLISNNKA